MLLPASAVAPCFLLGRLRELHFYFRLCVQQKCNGADAQCGKFFCVMACLHEQSFTKKFTQSICANAAKNQAGGAPEQANGYFFRVLACLPTTALVLCSAGGLHERRKKNSPHVAVVRDNRQAACGFGFAVFGQCDQQTAKPNTHKSRPKKTRDNTKSMTSFPQGTKNAAIPFFFFTDFIAAFFVAWHVFLWSVFFETV
jgi:hypothetical protein